MSTPYFANPGDVQEARQIFRSWLGELQTEGKMIANYHKIGKGSVVIFDVASNDELHRLLTQWLEIVNVPVDFEILPLASPAKAG